MSTAVSTQLFVHVLSLLPYPSPTLVYGGTDDTYGSSFIFGFQDNLKETEEKYRKAMVSIAQLDNEKQALLYQVDCLKDRYNIIILHLNDILA